jgi:DNA repair exonuclease SbcCD ATPase subunit
MGQLMAIGKEVDSFIAKQRVSVREKLIELHENVKSEARAKQKEISDMRATAAEWQRDLLKAKDAQARAMSELRTADQKRKGLSRFAERSAFAKADEVVEAAENRVDKTNAKVTAIQQQINNIALTELPRLDRELNEIAAREAELNAAVSGQGYTTELGIIVPPRAPAV